MAFTRQRLRKQLAKRGLSDRDLAFSDEVLNSEALTIGFARRFAPYKRAGLILMDAARLERILTNEDYPVQIIFAGKAHPQDQMGKDLIKQLFRKMKASASVSLVSEFRTSKLCSSCFQPLKNPTKDQYKVLCCDNSRCTHSHWNRDINAARNILMLYLYSLETYGKSIPKEFKGPQENKERTGSNPLGEE